MRISSIRKSTLHGYLFFFAFAYLPIFISLRRGAGPALGGDGKANAEPEKQNVLELVKTRSLPNYLSLQRFKGPGSRIFKYLLALRTLKHQCPVGRLFTMIKNKHFAIEPFPIHPPRFGTVSPIH